MQCVKQRREENRISADEEGALSNRVTIKSIAQDLGLSHMTVSRALSDNPNVQSETRARVMQRANELGYVKSAAAKAMRGGGMMIVGLLLPNITNEFYARFANVLARACSERSYQLIIHLTDDDTETERLSLKQLREVQSHAVAMVPTPGRRRYPAGLLADMKVIQLIRERPVSESVATVLVDDHDALRDAVVHLAKQGHSSIAYIGGNAELSSGRRRLRAYRAGIKAAGLVENRDLEFTGMPSFEMGNDYADQICDQARASAIVCGGFEISNGALNAIMTRKGQMRKGVGFVGYGDPSFYAWVGGGITTVHVPVEDLALHTSKLLTADWSSGAVNWNTKTLIKARLEVRS